MNAYKDNNNNNNKNWYEYTINHSQYKIPNPKIWRRARIIVSIKNKILG